MAGNCRSKIIIFVKLPSPLLILASQTPLTPMKAQNMKLSANFFSIKKKYNLL
jgi:hypothetical protein